jgi:hypothetical protein
MAAPGSDRGKDAARFEIIFSEAKLEGEPAAHRGFFRAMDCTDILDRERGQTERPGDFETGAHPHRFR